jgi:hypothetical protein
MPHELEGEHHPLALSLPPEEKLRRNWEAIPLDVAQSMAFEGEPVPVARIRATHARITPAALLKPRKAS